MKKRVKAQITVYAALSVIIVITLICTCIRSAAVSAKRAHMEAAATLSLEAVFAGYSNELLEEFDIFALKKTDEIQPLFQQYVNKNISGNNTDQSLRNQNAEVLSAQLKQYVMMTDEGGQCINREILSFMKYGVYEDLLNKMMKMKEEQQKSETLKQLTDAIASCETKLCEQDTYVLGIIQAVEGILVDNSGIAVQNGVPISTSSYFVKAALSAPLSMQSSGINNSMVYRSAENNAYYTDVVQLVCDMQEIVLDYQQLCKEQEEEAVYSDAEFQQYAADYDACYQRSQKALFDVFSGVSEMTKKALELTVSYEAASDSAMEEITACREMISQKRNIVGESLYQSLSEDISFMETQQKNGKNALCDMNQMKPELEERKEMMNKAKKILADINQPLEQEQCNEINKDLEKLKEVLLAINNTAFVFDYSGINFSEKKEGIKKIEELYDKMTKGILGLVIEENRISQKRISVENLAQEYMGSSSGSAISQEENNILYNEYLFMKFPSYTDYIQSDGTFDKDSEKLLDYMLEYILYGKKSDQDNLSQSVTELSVLREGMNMAYLLTDSVKKMEAEGLAASLVGFTGNMAVVKAAKYLILAAWAYGESILELKQLYQGEKVEFIKTKENWTLSLESLLKMDFAQKDKKSESKQGLSYEEYLKMFFLLERAEKKYYLTMSAMELRMIELGKTEFRMKDYIYQMEGSVLYKVPLIKQYYERTSTYRYG